MRSLSIFILLLWVVNNLSAQCDTGSEPECMCETADVLCSVSEIEHSATMSSYQHPGDGPSSGWCPPSASITDNPTWFAFIAWCNDIEMTVDFDNCTTVGGFVGAQLVVFTDCSWDESVGCEGACPSSTTLTVDLNDLTIGESYYVMLDGCNGSACDYTISVNTNGSCDEFIEDWSTPVTNEEIVCINDIVDYNVDNLQGATAWHWYLDNSELDVTDTPDYTIEWDTEGTYELCVDVSNICVDVDDDPDPNCVMITVTNPNAGVLDAEDNPECPGEEIEVTVENYNATADYIQYFIYVDMNNEVIKVVQGENIDYFTWPICENVKVYSLNFHMDEDIDVPDLGDDYFGSDCANNCCDEICLPIELIDEEDPEFDDAPADITLDCYFDLFELNLEDVEDLDVEDNCADNDLVVGSEVIMADTCQGGVIVREWRWEDDCGNVAFHQQTIAIGPLEVPSFANPPNDTLMSSIEYDTYAIPTLSYSTVALGSCGLSGSATPVIEDNRIGCSGSVQVSWTAVDSCGRTIMHLQNIMIEPTVDSRDTIYNVCDISGSGTVEINKSDLDPLVANDLTGYIISYYPSTADLMAMTNEIVFPINSGILPAPIIYVAIVDASGCNSELQINLSVNPLPEIQLLGTDVSCLGLNDGEIIIITTSSSPPVTIFQGVDTLLSGSLGNVGAGTYSYSVVDSLGCRNEDQITINEGIDLSFVSVNYTCDDNGTGTDDSDDFYFIEFLVTGGTGQFDLEVGGTIINTSFTYDVLSSITLPADGVPITLVALDQNCSAPFDLMPLIHCSNECELTREIFDFECNDNGTPLDATDDYFDVTLNISAVNGSATNSYNVIVNGVPCYTFTYDVDETFTVPIDINGIALVLQIEDEDQSDCTLILDGGDLIPCSNTCALAISIESINCVDPSTPWDNDDDLFNVEFIVTGVNTFTSYTLVLDGLSYDYGEVVLLEDFLIADGSFDLIVFDNEPSGTCSETVTIVPPAPCSSPCEVEILLLNEQDCNDNGTGMDDSDDFYFVDLEIGAILGTGTTYTLMDVLGTEYGPFNYNEQIELGPFVADGIDFEMYLLDAFNNICFTSFDFSQSPCSLCNYPPLDLTADNLILDCENTSSTISLMGITDQVTYNWEGPNNFNSDQESITIMVPGDYEITVTFMDGCTETGDITIDVSTDTPISDAGDDMVLNCLSSTVTLSGVLSQGASSAIYQWTDELGSVISSDVNIVVTEPGVYGLQLIDPANQCESDISYVTVTENYEEPTPTISGDPGYVLDCNISSIRLFVEVPEANTEYSWLVNGQVVQGDDLTISAADSIQLSAINTISGCRSDTSLVIVDLTEFPIISYEPIEKLDCETMMTCVTLNGPNTGNLVYNWYDESGTILSNEEGSYCFEATGIYTIELIDTTNNCQNDEEITIEGPIMPEISLPLSLSLEQGQTLELNPIVNVPEEQIAQIVWTTPNELSCYDCLRPTILEAQDSTVVALTITTVDGCEATAFIDLSVLKVPKIYVPNIFSLGQNDKFAIFSNDDIKTIDKLAIYDRWGSLKFVNEMFDTNDSSQGWDGRFNNRLVEQGVYVYVLEYTINGINEIKAGSVTIIR